MMLEAIGNHLWQSTLFAAALAVMTLAFRRNAAAIRFHLWFAASVKFLIPFSLLVALGNAFSPETPMSAAPAWTVTMTEVAQPAGTAASALTTAGAPSHSGPVAYLLIAVWACGFLFVGLRWLASWRRVRAMMRAARPLEIDSPIAAMSSPTTHEPGVFGIFRPALIVPEGILDRLSPAAFDAILAHELCHVRRRDNLTAAIHMLVEALFWFHPLVWWMGAGMMVERERACDEAVVGAGRDPEAYASAILDICRFYLEPPLPCISGVAGGNLKKRIEEIMTKRIAIRLNVSKKLLLAGAAAIALAGPLAVGVSGITSAATEGASPSQPDQAAFDRAHAERMEKFSEQAKTFKQVPIDPKLLDIYVGHYQLNDTVAMIAREGDHLTVRLTGQPAVEISPYDDHEFFQPDVHAQLTFDAVQGGKANEFVLHQGGMDQSFKRVSDAAAADVAAKLADRIKNKTPQPGSEAALRHCIEDLQSGHPRLDEMTDQLAEITREQYSLYQKMAPTAPLQSVTFQGVGTGGADIYEVKYPSATWVWRIALLPDGKVFGLSGHPAP